MIPKTVREAALKHRISVNLSRDAASGKPVYQIWRHGQTWRQIATTRTGALAKIKMLSKAKSLGRAHSRHRRPRHHRRHYGGAKNVVPWLVVIGGIAAVGGVIWWLDLQQKPLVMPTMDLTNV